MSSLSLLQLNQHFFTSVKVTANTNGKPDAALTTSVEFKGQVHQNDKRNWLVNIKVTFGAADAKVGPYEGSIECCGIFIVDQNWPENQIEKLVMVNGTGMLFSSAREMICSVTARSPFGMLILPTQSFLETWESTRKEKPQNANSPA